MIDNDLDTAVLLTSGCGIIVRNRTGHTNTRCGEPLWVDSLLYQVVFDRIGTAT